MLERSSLAKPDLKAATKSDSVREAGSEFHSGTVLMVKKFCNSLVEARGYWSLWWFWEKASPAEVCWFNHYQRTMHWYAAACGTKTLLVCGVDLIRNMTISLVMRHNQLNLFAYRGRNQVWRCILVVGVTSRGSQTKGRHIYLGWQQQIEQRLPPQTNMAPR